MITSKRFKGECVGSQSEFKLNVSDFLIETVSSGNVYQKTSIKGYSTKVWSVLEDTWKVKDT